MTWRRWQAARQLLAEESIGVGLRQADRQEDAAFRKATERLQRLK